MARWLIIDIGEGFGAWDKKWKALYLQSTVGESAIRVKPSLDMYMKFSPYSTIIDETEEAPDWIPEAPSINRARHLGIDINFRNVVYDHLSQYKVNVLGIKESGTFHYRGNDILKAHILPIRHREKNLLEKYRNHFFSSDYSQINYHQFFHHLNSSQALCINLFYPLIAENSLDLFIDYLGITSGSTVYSVFEKESEIENTTRRTSFDFYVQLDGTTNIFVEVKYTEDGFGKAKLDEHHREKFRATYLPLLVEKSEFFTPQCQEEELFLNNYQLLRNLVHISNTDLVVLLSPSANTAVLKESRYAMEHFLTPKGRERLYIVYLDELVSFLETEGARKSFGSYYQEFRIKYLP